MKVVIYYHSVFGNGERMAAMMAEKLQKNGYECQTVKITKSTRFDEAPLSIFSTPTHGGAPSRRMKNFLQDVPSNDGCYALMTTSYGGMKNNSTLDMMESVLEPKGMRKVSDFAVRLGGFRGPLPKDIPELLDEFVDKVRVGIQVFNR